MARIGRTTKDTGAREEIRLRELDRKVTDAAGSSSVSEDFAPPVAQLYATSAQAFVASTWTPVTFGQAIVDTYAGWDGGTRYVCPVDGVYLVAGVIGVPSAIRRVVKVTRNGIDVLASQGEQPAAAGVDVTASTPAVLVPCAAGDYLEFRLLVTANASSSFFAANANGNGMAVAWQGPLSA